MPLLKDLRLDLMIRRPARRRTLAQQLQALASSGERLQDRLTNAATSESNRKTLRHIIAIERWGQRRLQTILGEPAVTDESDAYEPAADLDWPTLCNLMRQTRQETMLLGQQIEEQQISDSVTAQHNSLGPLNAREWLYYLGFHSRIEALRIRR